MPRRVNIEKYLGQLDRYYSIQSLTHKGYSYTQIASLFGVTRQRVGIIAAHRFPPYPRGFGTLKVKEKPFCSVDGCNKHSAVYGKCPEHYALAHGITKQNNSAVDQALLLRLGEPKSSGKCLTRRSSVKNVMRNSTSRKESKLSTRKESLATLNGAQIAEARRNKSLSVTKAVEKRIETTDLR